MDRTEERKLMDRSADGVMGIAHDRGRILMCLWRPTDGNQGITATDGGLTDTDRRIERRDGQTEDDRWTDGQAGARTTITQCDAQSGPPGQR
jgi:hypothetical protein